MDERWVLSYQQFPSLPSIKRPELISKLLSQREILSYCIYRLRTSGESAEPERNVVVQIITVRTRQVPYITLNKYESALQGKATHSTENALHSMLNGLELGNTASLALNVLAQSTKSCEPDPTSRGRADIDFILVDRASKVLIQGLQRGVAAMTQVALVSIAVPGFAAGIVLDIVARGATGEQAGRVGNYVVCVVLAYGSVDSGTVDSRWTGTTFKVEDERGVRNEFHATGSGRARDILWTMGRRVEVLRTRFISKDDTN